MQTEAWLNEEHQFTPGERLFRSDRQFTVWAYTVSHSQLLLRTNGVDERTRIDILFKPVEAMKVRASYDGMTIRCATAGESGQILAATGQTGGLRVLILETAGGQDYVVTGAVGWKEDHGREGDRSALASFAPATDPGRILPAGAD